MTNISPLLQERLNNSSAHHDRYYESLTRHANNTVLPNEAKAHLVKNTPVTCAIDMGKDVVNLKNAVKTGEISDNNLGRLNDLGMKIGSGLIAAYLAVHSKTKTDALMKFIGGGAFLASMSLWPKLFINLPTKLMHKVDPGQKYITAQGDKKDLFLDNQFIVWDATGITDEKEQRHQQKTALQARTLNLATVGFASPLMASLIGNTVQPKVYNAVVKKGINKTARATATPESLKQYMDGAKASIKNEKAIEKLFESYKSEGKAPDKDLFTKLAKLLSITDIEENLKDSDDITPLKNMKTPDLAKELENIYSKQVAVDTDSLKEALKDVSLAKKMDKKNPIEMLLSKAELAKLKSEGKLKSVMSSEEIDEVVAKLGKDLSKEHVESVLLETGLTKEQVKDVLPKVKVNADKFYATITEYNKETLGKIRGKAKAYLDLLNNVAGSKYESAYTKEYTDTMKNLMDELGVDYKTLKSVEGKTSEECIPVLSELFSKKVAKAEYGSDKYKQLVAKLTKDATPEKIQDLVEKLAADDTLKSVKVEGGVESLNDIIIGSKDKRGSFVSSVSDFIQTKKIDLASSKVKPAICANYEARKAAGHFQDFTREELKLADLLVYSGNSSVRENLGYAHNKQTYENVVNRVFNKDMFNCEEEVIPGIKQLVEEIRAYSKTWDKNGNEIPFIPSKKYFNTGSISNLFKNTATRLYNDKSWLRKFGTIAIILTAATLLIQPFFGNIKKEYAEEKKGEGVK